MKRPLKLRKQPRQDRSKAMLKALLDAAARVLVRDGYARANTNAISRAAGVSVGSLYQYFPSKEALVAALHERHAQQMRAKFAELIAQRSPRSLEEALAVLVRAMLEAQRVDPRLHHVLESEVPYLDRFEGHDRTSSYLHDALAALVRAHRGEIKIRDPNLAAFIAGEIARALTRTTLLEGPKKVERSVIERETVRALLGYLTSAPSGGSGRKHGAGAS